MTKSKIRAMLRLAKELDNLSLDIKRKVIDAVDADDDITSTVLYPNRFNPEETILSLKYGDYPKFDDMQEGYDLDIPDIKFNADTCELKISN